MEAFYTRTRASIRPSRICASCRKSLLSRWCAVPSENNSELHTVARVQRRYKGHIAAAGKQAQPLAGFYADLLDTPTHKLQAATRTPPKAPPKEELPKTQKEETLQKARIVFGSKLAGPLARQEKIARESTMIAGVLVPPRPDEPDNCCMSGCVNCVWDQYRDELEEWAAKSAEARTKLQSQRNAGKRTGTMNVASETPAHVAVSMDDDGGGSETNWTSPAPDSNDLFRDIPVGIREFMKTEKRLKQQHQASGTTGG